MNYINLMSDDELKVFCDIISGSSFKAYYRQNSKEFSKIKPGFRASKLSNQEAVDLAVKSKNKPFISDFINDHVKNWLKEIEEFHNAQIGLGLSKQEALAKTLQNSVFYECIELYFKIAEKEISESELDVIKSLMPTYKEEETIIAAADDNIPDESSQASLDEMHEKYKAVVAENTSLKKDNDYLRLQVEEFTEQIENCQEDISAKEEELKALRERAEFDDSEVLDITNSEFEHLSLCIVEEEDYQGQIWVDRVADVTNGLLTRFIQSEDTPRFFENRSRLYWKDGPNKPGALGLWNWSSTPSRTDPTKDYVTTEYCQGVSPVEVFISPECSSIDEVVARLKGGLNYSRSVSRIIVAYKTTKGKYSGLLCNADDLDGTDGVLRIKETVTTLPLYDFSNLDFIKPDGIQKSFMRKISMGFPQDVIRTKDPLEIVKSVILKRTSWNAFKQKGISKREWQGYKDYIEECRTDSVIDDIATTCKCSQVEANNLLEQFIDNANSYIDGSTIEAQVLATVIQDSPELLARSKALIRDDWEKENEGLIASAKKNVEDARAEMFEATAEKERAEAAILEVQKRADQINEEISKKEKIAEDVETIIAERINKAQDNAAEFIANMAFVNRPLTIDAKSGTEETVKRSLLVVNNDGNAEEPDECHSYKDSIETIAFELEEAGVAEDYSKKLAAYLFASYVNRLSVLLCGPNATEIAQAFSIAMFGKYPAILNCSEEYDPAIIDACKACDNEVICISDPFDSKWVTKIPGIVSEIEKFFMAVYPYAEDIAIEPKGIFNYFNLVLTEVFINKPATKQFVGGFMARDYNGYEHKETKNLYPKVLSSLRMNKLVKYRTQTLLTDMQELLGENTPELCFDFLVLPYAFATLQGERLLENLEEKSFRDFDVSDESIEQAKYVMGISE